VVELLRQVLAISRPGNCVVAGGGSNTSPQRSAFPRQAALRRRRPMRRRRNQWQVFQRVRRTLRTSCVASTSLPGTS